MDTQITRFGDSSQSVAHQDNSRLGPSEIRFRVVPLVQLTVDGKIEGDASMGCKIYYDCQDRDNEAWVSVMRSEKVRLLISGRVNAGKRTWRQVLPRDANELWSGVKRTEAWCNTELVPFIRNRATFAPSTSPPLISHTRLACRTNTPEVRGVLSGYGIADTIPSARRLDELEEEEMSMDASTPAGVFYRMPGGAELRTVSEILAYLSTGGHIQRTLPQVSGSRIGPPGDVGDSTTSARKVLVRVVPTLEVSSAARIESGCPPMWRVELRCGEDLLEHWTKTMQQERNAESLLQALKVWRGRFTTDLYPSTPVERQRADKNRSQQLSYVFKQALSRDFNSQAKWGETVMYNPRLRTKKFSGPEGELSCISYEVTAKGIVTTSVCPCKPPSKVSANIRYAQKRNIGGETTWANLSLHQYLDGPMLLENMREGRDDSDGNTRSLSGTQETAKYLPEAIPGGASDSWGATAPVEITAGLGLREMGVCSFPCWDSYTEVEQRIHQSRCRTAEMADISPRMAAPVFVSAARQTQSRFENDSLSTIDHLGHTTPGPAGPHSFPAIPVPSSGEMVAFDPAMGLMHNYSAFDHGEGQNAVGSTSWIDQRYVDGVFPAQELEQSHWSGSAAWGEGGGLAMRPSLDDGFSIGLSTPPGSNSEVASDLWSGGLSAMWPNGNDYSVGETNQNRHPETTIAVHSQFMAERPLSDMGFVVGETLSSCEGVNTSANIEDEQRGTHNGPSTDPWVFLQASEDASEGRTTWRGAG